MDTHTAISATIRQRGQLTLPDSLRKRFSWLREGSVVHISTGEHDSILVQPYGAKTSGKKAGKLAKDFARIRTLGASDRKLSQVIIDDRYAH